MMIYLAKIKCLEPWQQKSEKIFYKSNHLREGWGWRIKKWSICQIESLMIESIAYEVGFNNNHCVHCVNIARL